MLRGNLSTRPFYNERFVSLVVVGGLVLALALLVFNVTSLYRLSGERAKQTAEEDVSRDEAKRVKGEADKLRQSLDRSNLLVLAKETGEANDLIDQRTFSWTEFFTIVEKNMPRDARLTAVSPRVERGVFKIVMIVNAKRRDEVATLMDALLATGTFKNILPVDSQTLEDGTLSTSLETEYLAVGAPAGKKSGRGDRP